jgi:hypothetical protein
MARPAAQQKKQREDDVMSPYQIAQERDTWYQPGKRRKENAPFVVGGEV